jgi:hypothetical protein
MKEIDLLPQWYKKGKKRQVNYRRQYLVIGGIFLVIVAWNFAATYSLSTVQARLNVVQQSLDSNASVAAKFRAFESEVEQLEDKKKLLSKLNSGINVSALIAEFSWVISDKIMLDEINVSTEKISTARTKTSSSVRLGSAAKKTSLAIPQNDYRFKVNISGLADNAENVAQLISSLENSQYFTQVIPGLLQNEKDSTHTKFQIDSYIANYVEKVSK